MTEWCVDNQQQQADLNSDAEEEQRITKHAKLKEGEAFRSAREHIGHLGYYNGTQCNGGRFLIEQ